MYTSAKLQWKSKAVYALAWAVPVCDICCARITP